MMKKTYISPAFVLVELRCKVNVLTGSIIVDSNHTINTEVDGNWVKEENSGSDWNNGSKSIWDNEW